VLEFPRTNERAKELNSKYRAEFDTASRMFAVWMSRPLGQRLAKSSLPGEVGGLTILLNTQACRQFRSIIELCRIGEAENAIVLARSLFETVLAVNFVLAPKLNIVIEPRRGKPDHKPGKPPTRAILPGKWQTRVRQSGERASKISHLKRAFIYYAHCTSENIDIAKDMRERHLAQTGEDLGSIALSALENAKKKIGPKWRSIQSANPNTYSGLRVNQLAVAAGGWFPMWYKTMYPDQSRKVHGIDPIVYIEKNPITGEYRPAWHSTDCSVWSTIYCGSMVFYCLMDHLNNYIGMGHATDSLVTTFKEELWKCYRPESADK